MVETVVAVLLVGLLLAVVVQVVLSVPALLSSSGAVPELEPATSDAPPVASSPAHAPASALVRIGVLVLLLTTRPRKRRSG